VEYIPKTKLSRESWELQEKSCDFLGCVEIHQNQIEDTANNYR